MAIKLSTHGHYLSKQKLFQLVALNWYHGKIHIGEKSRILWILILNSQKT